MTLYYTRLALVCSLCATLACDRVDQCVADCDSATATDGIPSGSSASSECIDNTEAATMFIAQNRDCETVLDCVRADGVCYAGALAGPCGEVGLAATAAVESWTELANDLEGSCECGAPECGADLMCNDTAQCETALFSQAYCPSIARDVQTFLAANKSCNTAADCRFAESICHVDDCSGVVLNTSANADDWARLDGLLWGCEETPKDPQFCNFVGECAFEVVCSPEGQCSAP